MPSLDAQYDAKVAAAKTAAVPPAPAAPNQVNTTTLAGIAAASTAASPAAPVPAATDPLKNKAVQPTAAPGFHYTWIGGTTTGSWQLYKDATISPVVGNAVVGSAVVEDPAITAAKIAADTAAKAAADAAAKVAADKAAADAAKAIQQTNAITSLTATFNAMGLGGDIAAAITDMVQKGYTTDTIMMIAQDPTSKDPVALAFQKRFPANADRIKAGLPPLSPADYMLNEKAYRAAMQQAGLPKGFYDSQQDFTKFIANDVSPSELQSRINTAADAIANADPFYTSSLKAMYGLTTGDMIAHALDPQAALPLLQKQAEALKIGTAAARQGWGISATGAENLYTQGVTAAQAASGFKTVAGMQTDQQRLAEIWGGDTAAQGQNLVAATFGTAGAAYADQQIKALQQKEINAFTGGSGVAKGSLGVSTEQTGGNL